MSVIDKAVELAALAKEVNRLDLYQKAVDLQSQITSLAGQNFELSMSLTEARKHVAELEDAFKIKGQIEFQHGVYYLTKDDGKKDGPFCTRCWDADRLLIRVDRNDKNYHCRQCDPNMVVKAPLPQPMARKPTGW
jgi:hypothetical protein